MWTQFILINFHFVLSVVAALIFFMVAWLYFDAWFEHRALKNVFKIAGFGIIAFSFLIQAVHIDSLLLNSSIVSEEVITLSIFITKVLGYLFIGVGFILDPLPIVPKTSGLTLSDVKGVLVLPLQGIAGFSLWGVVVPILAGFAAFLHLRRATLGLENHLKPIGWGLYIFAFYELLAFILKKEEFINVDTFEILKPFGMVWILSHIVLLAGVVVVGLWIFRYLLKRLLSQIFIIYSCSILLIFISITVVFTGLLLRNIELEALKQLETNTKVLNYAVESKNAETFSDVVAFSQSPVTVNLINSGKKEEIQNSAENYLLSKNLTSIVITDAEGIIVARGEDKESTGVSLSGDPYIKMGIEGRSSSSIVSKEGIFAPEISIAAISPVISKEKVIGVVMIERKLDNAFVDGIKKATGLEVSLYGNNKLSATTLLSLDEQSRANGIVEGKKTINDHVLKKGEFYQDTTEILNVPYLGSYMPIKEGNGKVLGMLFVGRPELTIIASAAKSMQTTFIIANILLLISIVPSYFIARYISRQVS